MQRWEHDDEDEEEDPLFNEDKEQPNPAACVASTVPNIDLEYGVFSLPFICLSLWMIYYGFAGVHAHVHCAFPLPTWLLVGGSILVTEVLLLTTFIAVAQHLQFLTYEAVNLAFKVVAVVCVFICVAWLSIGTIWLIDLMITEKEKHCSFYGFGWSLVTLGWSILVITLVSAICYWFGRGPELSTKQRCWNLFVTSVQAVGFCTLIIIYAYMLYLGIQYMDDEACEYDLPKWLLSGGILHLFFLLILLPCLFVHHRGKFDTASSDIILALSFLLFCSFTWLLFGSRWVYNLPAIEHHRTCPNEMYHFSWVYLSVVWSAMGLGSAGFFGVLCFMGKFTEQSQHLEIDIPPTPAPLQLHRLTHPSNLTLPTPPSRLLSHLQNFLPHNTSLNSLIRSTSHPNLPSTLTPIPMSPPSPLPSIPSTPTHIEARLTRGNTEDSPPTPSNSDMGHLISPTSSSDSPVTSTHIMVGIRHVTGFFQTPNKLIPPVRHSYNRIKDYPDSSTILISEMKNNNIHDNHNENTNNGGSGSKSKISPTLSSPTLMEENNRMSTSPNQRHFPAMKILIRDVY